MYEIALITQLITFARARVEAMRANPERGDVAEKVVLVGIFVALAIAVGVIITNAVTGNATRLSNQINSAP